MRVEHAWKLAKDFYGLDYLLLQHCEGVAWLARHIAEYCVVKGTMKEEDIRPTYIGGLLHDVGKTQTSIGYHCQMGKFMLEEHDRMSSIVALYHHQYPVSHWMVELKPLKDEQARNIAQLVSLCDKVEAAITRSNKFPNVAVKEVSNQFPYDEVAVEGLYELTKYNQKSNINGSPLYAKHPLGEEGTKPLKS